MQEIELKSTVTDEVDCWRRLEAAGARLVFAGRLEDRRFDTPRRELYARDHVLRVRTERDARGSRASLDWKGPTRSARGYKEREEITAGTEEPEALAVILERLGFVVSREIDRDVVTYELHGATVRFERFPRMDVLVEIEGPPEKIEDAIRVLGLPRDGFSTDRLVDFVRRFEERTGERAAVSDRELDGKYEHSIEDV
jgi:predicted adenylyl cyclase CyaB